MTFSISDIVREHRRLTGLSQAHLAKLAGVGKTVVFDLEHGKASVQLDTLQKILGVLNLSMRLEGPAMARVEGILEAKRLDEDEV